MRRRSPSTRAVENPWSYEEAAAAAAARHSHPPPPPPSPQPPPRLKSSPATMAGARRGPGFLLPFAFLYFIASGSCLELGGFPWPHHRQHKIPGPIKTVVVIMMENRSFDHMFGWLKKSRPDIDGLHGNETQRVVAGDPSSPELPVTEDAMYVDSDPGHSFEAIREQIFGSDDESAPEAPMNGFVQQALKEGLGMPRTAMSGFPPSAVPVYRELVNQFAVFDRWFASVPTSTQPNRVFLHTATSHGLQSNDRDSLIAGLPQKTIFESLEEDGLSWGVYYQDIPAVLFLRRLRRLKYVKNFHSFRVAFKRHARRGRLPNYAVIEQHYFDDEWDPANDDHPSHDVAEGQKLIKEVYEALRASPQWNETALLITYDEHGGFYDHVPTPVRGVPSPDGVVGPPPYNFKFERLGVRVPALLISPWIEKGTVIHRPDGPTPTSEYEHSSLPATVKKIFNLSADFLTRRDAWAGSFERYFKMRETPRTDCPEKMPDVNLRLRPFGAAEGAKRRLSEFQEELMQLAAELAGQHEREQFEDMLRGLTAGEASRYVRDAAARFVDAGRAALRAGANASELVEIGSWMVRRIDEPAAGRRSSS